jgi:hypothetical protein
MASWKTRIIVFYCGFLDRNLSIKQARASFVECLKLLKAIYIVVEKVLKAFLKAIMTYYQIMNNYASDYGAPFVHLLFIIVGRIRSQFCSNCAVSEESTILTVFYYVCLDFDTSMNIRYGGICEINADILIAKKFEI